jgi:hypothetical protein
VSELRLSELNGRLRQIKQPSGLTEALSFTCPTCPEERRHTITVPWSGPSIFRSGDVWKLESAPEIDVLTLSPSINCDVPPEYGPGWSDEEKAEDERKRCRFHGWVRNGMVRW